MLTNGAYIGTHQRAQQVLTADGTLTSVTVDGIAVTAQQLTKLDIGPDPDLLGSRPKLFTLQVLEPLLIITTL